MFWPPLEEAELGELRDSIRANGILTPLHIWSHEGRSILLDGHHRLEVARELGCSEVRALILDIAGREEAIDWILKCQVSRRNVRPQVRAYAVGCLYNRAKSPRGGDRRSKSAAETLKNCSVEIAGTKKMAPSTIKKYGQFAEAVDALGIREAVMSGKEKRSIDQIVSAWRPKRSASHSVAEIETTEPSQTDCPENAEPVGNEEGAAENRHCGESERSDEIGQLATNGGDPGEMTAESEAGSAGESPAEADCIPGSGAPPDALAEARRIAQQIRRFPWDECDSSARIQAIKLIRQELEDCCSQEIPVRKPTRRKKDDPDQMLLDFKSQ